MSQPFDHVTKLHSSMLWGQSPLMSFLVPFNIKCATPGLKQLVVASLRPRSRNTSIAAAHLV
jgi:hypothetical protein